MLFRWFYALCDLVMIVYYHRQKKRILHNHFIFPNAGRLIPVATALVGWTDYLLLPRWFDGDRKAWSPRNGVKAANQKFAGRHLADCRRY